MISSFIEILISSYLNIKSPLFTANGESLGYYVANIAIILAIVILPIVYAWVINRSLIEIENPEFIERWGTFYAESRISSHWYLLFNFFSLLRRLLFVCFVLFVPV